MGGTAPADASFSLASSRGEKFGIGRCILTSRDQCGTGGLHHDRCEVWRRLRHRSWFKGRRSGREPPETNDVMARGEADVEMKRSGVYTALRAPARRERHAVAHAAYGDRPSP
jgi:hypothetical protein